MCSGDWQLCQYSGGSTEMSDDKLLVSMCNASVSADSNCD